MYLNIAFRNITIFIIKYISLRAGANPILIVMQWIGQNESTKKL